MFPNFRLKGQLSHGVMALALVAVAGASLATVEPAFAKGEQSAKPNYSKPFVAAAGPYQKALEAAKKRADVVAAQQAVTDASNALRGANGAARKAAQAQRDSAMAALAATLAPEKALLDAATAVATTPDDKFMAGNMALQFGGLAQDNVAQWHGLQAMVDSGKANPAELPKYQFFIGQFAYDAKDYTAARTAFQTAIDGGYTNNDVGVLLAESYISDKQPQVGLEKLQSAIATQNATGTPAPENWYRRGLGVAYKEKLLDKAAAFSNGLVQAYPSQDNWAGAISVLRITAKYELQDRLDLMRLMERTHSFSESSDYAEFIQAADPRRLPAEVLTVIDEGLKAGKLDATDLFVTDARTNAQARVKEDKPTLPGLEKSALAANATGVSAAATADALLSYGEPAKAEALYALALQRGGVDVQRVQTRIGIAQFDQGKFADAKASFDKVTGIRVPLAQLWSVYCAQKLKGA